MKFNLLSMLVAIALLAVVVAWVIDHQQLTQTVEDLQGQISEARIESKEETYTEVLLENARGITTARTLEDLRSAHASYLSNEFYLLSVRAAKTSEDSSKFKAIVEQAGEVLFLTGWITESSEQLHKKLLKYHDETGAPNPVSKTFLSQAIEQGKQRLTNVGEAFDLITP